MNVVSFKTLKQFFIKNANARVALQDWNKRTRKADWDDFSDLKCSFNSADNVGNGRYVFNVKGNHYRIVVIVRFSLKRVYIRWVGNHKDYDKLKNITEL